MKIVCISNKYHDSSDELFCWAITRAVNSAILAVRLSTFFSNSSFPLPPIRSSLLISGVAIPCPWGPSVTGEWCKLCEELLALAFDRNGFCFRLDNFWEDCEPLVGPSGSVLNAGPMEENSGTLPRTVSFARSKSQITPTMGEWVILRRMMRALRSLGVCVSYMKRCHHSKQCIELDLLFCRDKKTEWSNE